MKKQDEKIKKYLNAYAEEVKPDKNSALSLARQEMQKIKRENAEKEAKKNSITQKNNSSGAKNSKRWRAPVLAICSACVMVVLVASVIGNFLIGDKNKGDSLAPSVEYNIYTASQLSAESSSREQLANLNINITHADGAVTEKYKLYKLKENKEPILVESKYRFLSENGGYEDVTIFTELKDNYMYDGNQKFKNLRMYNSEKGIRAQSGYIDGEYYTNAFIKQNYVYCLSVMSPNYCETNKYIELFFS